MESAPVQKVIYQPLNPRNQEIRLVTIKAGRGIDPVECSLTQVSLDHKPQYEALSYVWGDPNNPSHIILQGGVFSVTSNLGTALSYLRLPEVDRTMWIDAICIDQNNFAERESQVQIMRLIYQEAEKVVSWIGAFKHQRTVMETAALLDEAHNHDFSTAWLRDALTTGDRCAKQIHHFVSFCHKAFDYWSRIWITQEVALARNGIVKWKKIEIPYRWFGKLYSTFLKIARDVKWTIKYFGLAGVSVFQDSCKTLAQNDIMLRKTTLGTPLLDLLRQNRHKEATDPRDKVYALLGLSDMAPNSHEGLTVSYAKNWSKRDVYTGVVRAVVHKTLSLNILCDARPYADTPSLRSNPNNQESRLPSWAPDWTVTPMNTFPGRLQNGKGASGLTPACVDFYGDKNIIRAQGICVGIIKTCGRCLPNPPIVTKPYNNTLVEGICYEWVENWTRVSGDNVDSFEAFCRTIFLGQKSPPILQKILAATDPHSVPSRLKSEWFPLLHRSIGGFRFFTMNSINGPLLSNGDVSLLPGIGPGELQEKDKICVLFGCKCPVALRPDGNRYRFVSSVFIDSLHNGEAVEGFKTGRYSLDWFEMH